MDNGKTQKIHDAIEEWMAAAQADGLSPEEQELFDRHLRDCEACWNLYTDERRLAALAEDALAADRPAGDFEERMVMAFRDKVNQEEQPTARPAGSARWVRRLGAAAASLVLLGGLAAALGVFINEGSGTFQANDVECGGAKPATIASETVDEGYPGPAIHFATPSDRLVVDGSTLTPVEDVLEKRARVVAVNSKETAKKPFRGKYWNSSAGVGGRKNSKSAGSGGGGYGVASPGGWTSSKPGEMAPSPDTTSGKPEREHNTEQYDYIRENDFVTTADDPRSTFSIDVDTASYANVRRFLNAGRIPPKDAVRLEEIVNYFHYDYAPPTDGSPFAVHMEVCECPWNAKHRLVRVGVKGKVVAKDKRPFTNLVFLIDVSGSMGHHLKLPLVKQTLKMLVQELGENDRISMVVYAGASGVVLDSATCDKKSDILGALERLRSGGSTHGSAGIHLAYQMAVKNFVKGGVNRVILCTDGDFNVGVTSRSELIRLIKAQAKSGVFLTVLGFGMGNYKDATLEQIANKGNGSYCYVDSLAEARKIMQQELSGTLMTIAKDVKIQVEFNPVEAKAHRLIGYVNRKLAHRDFNDDKKDAGEIGAGHCVTALYEVIPADQDAESTDPLKYSKKHTPTEAAFSGELVNVRIRYKDPEASKSKLIDFTVTDGEATISSSSRDFRWATAVASFAMVLRESKYKGDATFQSVLIIAEESLGRDPQGYRAEFVKLVRRAMALRGR